MTAELLIVIALWCGQPVQVGFMSVLPREVNKCRETLIQCFQEGRGKFGLLDPDKQLKCLKEAKL